MMAAKAAGARMAGRGIEVFRKLRLLQHLLIVGCALAAAVAGAKAQEHIGSTALAHNDVTRDLSGASAPLVTGDSVFRNEVVRTGPDSTAKLIFLDSTNLGVGPVSSVKLDQFVYVGESNGQKMTVNLAKGVFPLHDRRPGQEGL